MDKNINEKIMAVANDRDLMERMVAADSVEECYAMAKDRLAGVSLEEFQAAMTAVGTGNMKDGELSDEDLDGVAGGVAVRSRSRANDGFSESLKQRLQEMSGIN